MVDIKTAIHELNTGKIEFDYKDDDCCTTEGEVVILLERLAKLETSDIVEVVRCKDCGSYNKHYGECTLNGSHFGENGYCCRGTRTPKERGGEK